MPLLSQGIQPPSRLETHGCSCLSKFCHLEKAGFFFFGSVGGVVSSRDVTGAFYGFMKSIRRPSDVMLCALVIRD